MGPLAQLLNPIFRGGAGGQGSLHLSPPSGGAGSPNLPISISGLHPIQNIMKPPLSINPAPGNFAGMATRAWQPTQPGLDSANPLQQLLASFFGPQGQASGQGNAMYGQFGGGVPDYMQGLMSILNFLGAPLFTRGLY